MDPDNPSITIAKKRYDIRLTRHDEWEVDVASRKLRQREDFPEWFGKWVAETVNV